MNGLLQRDAVLRTNPRPTGRISPGPSYFWSAFHHGKSRYYDTHTRQRSGSIPRRLDPTGHIAYGHAYVLSVSVVPDEIDETVPKVWISAATGRTGVRL